MSVRHTKTTLYTIFKRKCNNRELSEKMRLGVDMPFDVVYNHF